MASRKSPVQKRNDVISMDEYTHTHQPVINNTLRIKLDHLKTFEPLTDNQRFFYEAYKRGDYFLALHGVAGTGKTFIAVYKALEEVLDKTNPFNKIIIVQIFVYL